MKLLRLKRKIKVSDVNKKITACIRSNVEVIRACYIYRITFMYEQVEALSNNGPLAQLVRASC